MTIDQAINFFGNLHQVCKAIGITSQNMTSWKKQGYIPWKQQFKIAMVTEGQLMPDEVDPNFMRISKKTKSGEENVIKEGLHNDCELFQA